MLRYFATAVATVWTCVRSVPMQLRECLARAARAVRSRIGRPWRAVRRAEWRIRPYVRRAQVVYLYCQVSVAVLTVWESTRMTVSPNSESIIQQFFSLLFSSLF